MAKDPRGKKESTAAGLENSPSDRSSYGDKPHARNYPGKKTPKPFKVTEGGSHNPAELTAGRGNSLGTSEVGSHKGMPANKSRDYIGQDGFDTSKDPALGKPRDVAATAKHNQAELEAGRTNSLGTSTNGSHKGLPVEYPMVGRHGV